jgi:hypothetical protein
VAVPGARAPWHDDRALAITANNKEVITSSRWLDLVMASLVALSAMVILSALRECATEQER